MAICEDLDDDRDARLIAHRIEGALAEPFAFEAVAVSITACIGIATAKGGDADLVLRHADAALYGAKASGRGSVVLHATR